MTTSTGVMQQQFSGKRSQESSSLVTSVDSFSPSESLSSSSLSSSSSSKSSNSPSSIRTSKWDNDVVDTLIKASFWRPYERQRKNNLSNMMRIGRRRKRIANRSTNNQHSQPAADVASKVF
ncbi:unnamed protein product [Anisakis simplex]|uniref:Wsv025 n=1 Tax=Anisakis simplex TaxID=6269 RepID=A0A0M3JZR3_ANISI|nr:unnamed protein product [Anisakis simplex]